jgi:hypothetical protein
MSLHALGISVDVNIRQLSVKKKLLNYILSWNTFVPSVSSGSSSRYENLQEKK